MGVDVVFPEPEDNTGLSILRELAPSSLGVDGTVAIVLPQITPRIEHDRLPAEELCARAVEPDYYFTDSGAAGGAVQMSGLLQAPVLLARILAGKNVHSTSSKGEGVNPAVRQRAAASRGHFNTLSDEDGIIPRVAMLAKRDGGYYEPLSLRRVRIAPGSPKFVPRVRVALHLDQKSPGSGTAAGREVAGSRGRNEGYARPASRRGSKLSICF